MISILKRASRWCRMIVVLASLSITTSASAETTPDPDPTLTIQNNSPSNYAELVATIIPRRNKGIKQRLRSACQFLPMPPALGWESDPLDEDVPLQDLVPGLVLSDIKSGATRRVDALWMHALYTHTRDTQLHGATALNLREAHFSARFGWGHRLVVICLLVQLSVAFYAVKRNQRRDALLIFVGLLLQLLEGVHWWACPKYVALRSVENPRYYALHTGPTTTHILVLSHNRGSGSVHYNLEDAAVPLPRILIDRRAKLIEKTLANLLRLCWWIYRAACVLTATNGLLLPVVLSIGFGVIEFLSTTVESLPDYTSRTPLNATSHLLDILASVGQYTGSVSVGFVESILPDPEGLHRDYIWVQDFMKTGIRAGPHPAHPAAHTILLSGLKRRTIDQTII